MLVKFRVPKFVSGHHLLGVGVEVMIRLDGTEFKGRKPPLESCLKTKPSHQILSFHMFPLICNRTTLSQRKKPKDHGGVIQTCCVGRLDATTFVQAPDTWCQTHGGAQNENSSICNGEYVPNFFGDFSF